VTRRDAILRSGERVGHLRILREIGAGAFGRVYLAEDELIGRQVALKVVPLPAGELVRESENRILHEARAVGGLSNPHIVTLFRVHPPGDVPAWMFEMEYMPGGTLADLLEKTGALPAERASAIARGIADALRAAHAAAILHGDLKPGNVLLGPGDGVKLADFGLSRILGDWTLSTSRTAQLAGTPTYMAPEVIAGEHPTPAADAWSLGVLCYRMLTGALPFTGTNLAELFCAIQSSEPRPAPPGVDAHLLGLALGWLRKSPGERLVISRDAFVRGAPPPAVLPPVAPSGREKEARRLRDAVERAGGRAEVVLLSGESGIGKTTLLAQVRDFAAMRGARWVEAAVSPLEGALIPLLEAVRRALAEQGGPRVGDRLGISSGALRSLMTGDGDLAARRRPEAVWALEQALRALAAAGPLVLCIEDVHVADAEDVRLLKHLTSSVPALHAVLLLAGRSHEAGTSTPDPVSELATAQGVDHIPLGPLPREAVGRVLDAAAGCPVEPEIVERVHSMTEGNPLFAQEMVRHLIQVRGVVRQGGSLRPSATFESASLPRRFHDLVAQRVSGLTSEDRALLEAAAVDGRNIDGDALASIVGQPLLTILRRLQHIHREQRLVSPGPDGFRFGSLVQEVVYAELARPLRRALHLAFAEHLEARDPTVRAQPERLADHWERAGQPARARPHLLRAARAAAARLELRRTIGFCERAGFVPGKIGNAEALESAELLLALIWVYHDAGRPDESAAAAERLLEAAAEAGDETLRLRAVVAAAEMRYFSHGLDASDEAALREAAETLPPGTSLGLARYILGIAAKYRGRLEEARTWFERADKAFVAAGNEGRHSSALDQLASVAFRAGRSGDAERLYAEAARVSAQVGRRANASTSEINRALVALHRGRLDGLEAILEESIRVLNLEGARNLAGHASVILARVRYAQGDLRAANAQLDRAFALLGGTTYLPGLASAHQERAHLAGVVGNLDQARTELEAAQGLAARLDDKELVALCATLSSHLCCYEGDAEGAVGAAESAIGIANEMAEPRLSGDLAAWLFEAALYGVHSGSLAVLAPLLSDVERGTTMEVAAALLPAANALATERGGARELRRAAELLDHGPVGDRRAALRACAAWVEAEALRREGDIDAAVVAAARGLERASHLGHVWLSAGLMRLQHRLTGDPATLRRLEQHVGRLCGSREARAGDRLTAFWTR
jgi:serine/threonine protein kinase/tetratricopeptide (TPR) repeat protein